LTWFIINNNTETVSTDFDTADRLYFEPFIRLRDEITDWGAHRVVVAFGGQSAIKLTKRLRQEGIRITVLCDTIDMAEDGPVWTFTRESHIGAPRPQLRRGGSPEAAQDQGYPVLMRPPTFGRAKHDHSTDESDIGEKMTVIFGRSREPRPDQKYLSGRCWKSNASALGDILIPALWST
jgi:carbamoyl-phosphate synthase large subunit